MVGHRIGSSSASRSAVRVLFSTHGAVEEYLLAKSQLDSALATKLSTFLPLSPDELKCLAEIQSPPLAVKRGKPLVHGGQTGHKAFVFKLVGDAVTNSCQTVGVRLFRSR